MEHREVNESVDQGEIRKRLKLCEFPESLDSQSGGRCRISSSSTIDLSIANAVAIDAASGLLHVLQSYHGMASWRIYKARDMGLR